MQSRDGILDVVGSCYRSVNSKRALQIMIYSKLSFFGFFATVEPILGILG